jgi:tetratricopeptide (TPR) repeat protein
VHFGVDVRVPWEAGERPEADFNGGPATYSKTRALGDGTDADETRAMERAWAAKAIAGASDERPWERVGGVGFDAPAMTPKKSLAWKASDAVARDATAEALNDQGMALYAKKKYADALALYIEAARKEPGKIAYQGNVAAAALLHANELRDASPQKVEVLEIAISACESAIAMDEGYVRGYVRAGKALLALGDAMQNVGKLKRARELLSKALDLDAANSGAKAALKDVEISLQLFDSDSD